MVKAFIDGVARSLDIGAALRSGPAPSPLLSHSKSGGFFGYRLLSPGLGSDQQDTAALSGDWAAVGEGVAKAMAENPPKEQ